MQHIRLDKIIDTIQQLNFEDVYDQAVLPIENVIECPIWYRVFLTNPDNYFISNPYGLLQPKQKVQLTLRMKVNDSISPFNYRKNKLQIMCFEYPATEPISPQIFVGRQLSKISLTQVMITVDCVGFRKLTEASLKKLKMHLQITRQANREIKEEDYLFIKRYCATIGTVQSLKVLDAYAHASFVQPLQGFQPRIMVLRGDKEQILSVFSVSFFSTFMGPQIPDVDVPPSLKWKFDMEVSKNVQDFISFQDWVICKTPNRLIIYNAKTQQSQGFEHNDFKIGLFPPYLCTAMQGKFLIFYQNFQEIKITKIKMKKLIVKCFFKFNNSLYVAGRNCSKAPLIKPTTTRRQIYIIKNFTLESKEVSPDDTIQLPESPNDVEIMLGQNPYMFAYCSPNIMLINMKTKEIVSTFNKQLKYVQLLEGRYANSLVSAIAITIDDRFCRVNFEQFGLIYGVQVNESNQKVRSMCQAKDGRVFISNDTQIMQFHAKKFKIINSQVLATNGQVLKIIRTNTKGDIVTYKQSNDGIIQFYKQI